MATRLKTPITVTIHHVENALNIMRAYDYAKDSPHWKASRILSDAVPNEIGGQIQAGLEPQGIDWLTWTPPVPFKIAGHETTFNPDGSIKVGCTTVSSNEFKAVQDKRTEAMNASYNGCSAQEQEYPRFWRTTGNTIMEARSVDDIGICHSKHGSVETSEAGGKMVEFCERHCHVPITRTSAAKQIQEWEKARESKPAKRPRYFINRVLPGNSQSKPTAVVTCESDGSGTYWDRHGVNAKWATEDAAGRCEALGMQEVSIAVAGGAIAEMWR